MITIQNLSYNFDKHAALSNCSFHLDAGDFLFLTGHSGAGKSSLLKILYGELPLRQGKASIAGFSLNHLQPRQIPALRQTISVVFQDFKILPHWNIYENIALALRIRGFSTQRIHSRVESVAKALGLHRKMYHLCSTLSGGEQQRVAIARALVAKPSVILADEPTGNLDPKLSLRLLDIFVQFKERGTTVIFATHSMELLERYPVAKQINLTQGKITAANWEGAIITR